MITKDMRIDQSAIDSFVGDEKEHKPITLAENDAVKLVRTASDWLTEEFGISTDGFFKNVDEASLTGEPIPIYFVKPETALLCNLPLYWIWKCKSTSLIPEPTDYGRHGMYPFTYFTSYDKALSQHEENIHAGFDSYVLGAGGGGSAVAINEITRQLFQPKNSVAYGLMVTLHEPVHPWVMHITSVPELNEAITTYLGNSILLKFSEHLEHHDSPIVAQGIRMLVEDLRLQNEFERLAYARLNQIYINSGGQSSQRPQVADTLLKECSDLNIQIKSRKENKPPYYQFNNAVLASAFPYTNNILVGKYFDENDIPWEHFISDRSLRDKVKEPLLAYIYTAYDNSSTLDESWTNVVERIHLLAGKHSLVEQQTVFTTPSAKSPF